MAEITLRDYCEDAKELVRADSYDQAIAICRHILRHYPKHIMSYRLMGEACLEKGDYVEAANLFKRVLSADLEDVIVYVGLGIIFDEQGAMEEAIWQLERAFELTPGNAEIRGELQRLYKERDGAVPPKLKLTPAALGRLYLREGLHQRAIDEFRGVLEEDPDRADIQVTLADALWQSDQRREAAKVCEEILEKFPNSLKANLILGEILLNSDREEQSRALLRSAQDMDPENIVAQELFRDQSPLPLEHIHVPRLEEAELESEVAVISPEVPAPVARSEPEEKAPPLIPEAELEEAMPDWLRELQEGERETTAEGDQGPTQAEEMPDWLRELERETPEVPEAATDSSEKPPMAKKEMPAWLHDFNGARGAAEETSAPLAAEEELAQEGLQGEPSVVATQREEFSAIGDEEVGISEETLAGLEETMPDESAYVDETMKWEERSKALTAEEGPAQEAAEEGTVPAEGVPDWLGELSAEGAEEETPDWLQTSRAEADESVPSEEEVTLEAEDIPPWLGELKGEPGQADVTGLGDGIADLSEEVAAEEEQQMMEPSLEETERESPVAATPQEEPPTIEEEEVEISEETLARLHETMPDESASIEEIMAWMERSKALIADEAVLEEVTEGKVEGPSEEIQPAPPSSDEEEVPTWLRELKPEAAKEELEAALDKAEAPVGEAAVPTPEEEIPTWLRKLRPEAAEEETEAPVEEAEAAVGEAVVPPKEEEVPSWLLDLRAEAAEEKVELPSEEVGPAIEKAAEAVQEEEAPTWLRDLRTEAEEEEPAAVPEEAAAPAEEAAMPIPEEEMPSWLRELRAEAAREEVETAPKEAEAPIEEVARTVEEEEIPTWLRDLGPEAKEEALAPSEEAEALPAEAAVPISEEEMPSWLRDLSAERPTAEGEVGPQEVEAPTEEAAVPISEDEIPSWLRQLRAESAPEEVEAPLEEAEARLPEALAPIEEEVPSWLEDLRTEAEKEEAVPTPEQAQARPEEIEPTVREVEAPTEEGELPSWLQELRAEAAAGELTPLSEELEARLEEMPTDEEELPTWLLELRAEAERHKTAIPSEEAEAPAEEVLARPPAPMAEEEVEPVLTPEAVPPFVEEEQPPIEAVPPEPLAEVAPPADQIEEAADRAAWTIEDYLEHLTSHPRDHDARLALARAYAQMGDLDQALFHYSELISYGSSLFDDVIDDLEATVDDAPDHLLTHELLADAYMKGGRLQKALSEYRWLRVRLGS